MKSIITIRATGSVADDKGKLRTIVSMEPSPNDIVRSYLLVLKGLNPRASAFKESLLPFPKPVLKKALLKHIRESKDRPSRERAAGIHIYIALAKFIAADDAQFMSQVDKITERYGDAISKGQTPDKDTLDRMRKYEEGFYRIQKRITRQERELLADIAALDAGLTIEPAGDGYILKRKLPETE